MIIAALVYGGLRGLRRGLTRSVLGLAGLVLGLVLAVRLYRPLCEYLELHYSAVSRLAGSIGPHLPLASTVSSSPAGEGSALLDAVHGLTLPEFILRYLVTGAERMSGLPEAITIGEALSALLASSLVGALCFVGIFFATQLAALILSAVIGGAISVTPLAILDRLAGLILGVTYAAVIMTVLLGGLSLLAAMPAFAFLGSSLENSSLVPAFLAFFRVLLPRVPVVFGPG